MGRKDRKDRFHLKSKSSSDSDNSPSKRHKTDKESSSKLEFIKEPVYNIKQVDDIAFGKRSKFLVFGSAPRITSSQAKAVIEAKKLAMTESIKIVLMKQSAAHQQQSIIHQRSQIQRQQALCLMCRVYVGSISFELKEETIRAAFLPFGPIKTINMSYDPSTQKHKGFAFVEYEIPEGAQLALEQMNGTLLGGRNIKGRPSNMPQAQQVIDEIQEEAKNYNRIYISSIHPELTEEDIKSVFEAFGGIEYCKLADGSSVGKHKGYGFIEYATNQAALESIASMNLFDLGGQLLRVGKSITPPNALIYAREEGVRDSRLPIAASLAAAAVTAKIQAMDALQAHVLGTAVPSLKSLSPSVISSFITPASSNSVLPAKSISSASTTSTSNKSSAQATGEELVKQKQDELQKKLMDESESTLQQQESMTIKGQNARHLVMQRLMRSQESKVIILKNMVGPEDAEDEMLQEEIQDECSKYGAVEKVIIYKEKQSDNDNEKHEDIIVKIFVQFSMSSEAEKAKMALNGRFFGGRLVKADSYDQALFDHNDFSG